MRPFFVPNTTEAFGILSVHAIFAMILPRRIYDFKDEKGDYLMTTGNKDVLDNAVDLSDLGITFTSKPLIIGGMAMEYYGIRKTGKDVDFIISNEDYKKLAAKYPDNRKDKWGDLGILIGKYELFRSIFRLDYNFYSQGAVEHEKYKVVSLEKLFFMKVIAFDNQPEVERYTNDYKLIMQYYFENFQNEEYVKNALKHESLYIKIPNGTVYKGDYSQA